ncbi:putative hydrolase of the HAD superfamily [Ferrimonas sediminum]|uniref:Putative hydrolase of the HAD superfamily n=1 Tax=Ferrimonas sediminum TaxID=718193 RepID=A0A1G8VLF7_9GAMM|nr:pyrimidine 5'-nucleotidase [Ferrimonas sediminum]SDJ66010.1 putative hydrolase of the HAD superfamily [Ferrimonas sediminum]
MSPLQERSVFLFDLDNTLYHPEAGILDQVGSRMKHYVADKLALSPEQATELCFGYYHKYGGTLRGLQQHHPEVDLDDFSVYAHDVDTSKLHHNPALAEQLNALSQKRYIFTNAALPYARRLMEIIGIEDCFDGIFSVEDTGYKMKPDPHAYEQIARKFGFQGSDAVMFDDQPSNLDTAQTFGIRTVLVNRPDVSQHNACYATSSLAHFLRKLNQIQP